jgi:N-acetylmuramoyl-L-alanine amidase
MSNRGVKEQDVWVLNGSKNPSVLVEIGFISNPLEEKLMLEGGWQAKMASAIAEGLFDYISGY